MTDRPRLLYLITEDWFFWSHWLDVARAARDAGFDVTIATRVTDHSERITGEGFQLLPLGMVRRSHNPFRELIAIGELVRLYRRVRPDIVHHVAMKPILYGSLAAWISGVSGVVNEFAGLGHTFTQEGNGLLHWCVKTGLRTVVGLGGSTVLVQNRDNQDQLVRERIVRIARTKIIAGSGVDVKMFSSKVSPSGIPIVLLPARMLWDKGVGEFVGAARRLKGHGIQARFILAGRRDEHNPAAIPESSLVEWAREGVVEWWRHREDMPAVYEAATLVVLPSYYGEGLPKVLLEAAACGKAIVTTDMPGCRDVVQDRHNGILVPPRDSTALAAAIEELLTDGRSREVMGRRGRELAVAQWSVQRIAEQVLSVYSELLKGTSSMDRLNGYV